MAVDIVIEDDGWTRVLEGAAPLEAFVGEWVEATLTDRLGARSRRFSIDVLLADDEAIAALNVTWRNRPGPTNILSFPALEPDATQAIVAGEPLDAGHLPPDFQNDYAVPLGDLALARETIGREAKVQGKPVRDHLAHLLVHGTLHLLGYDHETEHDARTMEGIEKDILAGRGIPDPYAGDDMPEDDAAHARPAQ